MVQVYIGASEQDISDTWSNLSDSSYQSIDFETFSQNYNIENGSPFDTNYFIVVHYNINSITADGRLEELTDICKVLKVGALVCTESKLDQTIPDNIILIDGFHEPLRKDRTRQGGGTLIYISEHLAFIRQHDLEEPHYEHIWADIKVNNMQFTLNVFYRPPYESQDDHTNFLATAEIILTKIKSHTYDNAIIASDLNFGNSYCKYPILTPKPLDYSAPDLFESFGMTQLIDIPTRVTEDTTSLIDLFFTTNPENALNYGTLPKIADHDGIVCSFNINNEKPKSKFRLVYDYSKADEKGLINFIKNFDFQNSVYSLPIIEQAEKFSLILQDAFALFVPCKTVMIRPKEQHWCNSFTRLLLRKKTEITNYLKKSNSKCINELTKNNPDNDTVCRLKLNRDKAFTKSKRAIFLTNILLESQQSPTLMTNSSAF